MKGIRLAQVLMLSSAFFLSCRQALAFSAKPAFARTAARFVHRLQVQVDREADYVEMVLGGERYSMVPLPDSMVSTTVVVKNLCEFVHDEDLSALFQKVSFLRSLPACVARKADMTSMQYGFVTFPSEDEKEVRVPLDATLGFAGAERFRACRLPLFDSMAWNGEESSSR